MADTIEDNVVVKSKQLEREFSTKSNRSKLIFNYFQMLSNSWMASV
jgi:hypothetical protein